MNDEKYPYWWTRGCWNVYTEPPVGYTQETYCCEVVHKNGKFAVSVDCRHYRNDASTAKSENDYFSGYRYKSEEAAYKAGMKLKEKYESLEYSLDESD